MARFIIEILAQAEIGKKAAKMTYEKIITTTVEVEGDVIRESEQFDMYTRYEEYYDFDIMESVPVKNNDFEVIDHAGKTLDCYAKHDYEIRKILKVFETDIKSIEE